jgi:hypothetical protein
MTSIVYRIDRRICDAPVSSADLYSLIDSYYGDRHHTPPISIAIVR